LTSPAGAQGLRTVVEARDRVFTKLGAGVTALKKDSAGRYYVLAKPATEIRVYDPSGNLTGKIPNANSGGAVIRYAVDIDLSPDGLIAVADRGSNAIEVFHTDGSLEVRIPVVAPTSVVALSGGQFAVTSLVSKRLVEVIDQRGRVLRSFGDPSDLGIHLDPHQPLKDLGRIIGDPSGGIYFAFTSLADPTVRKFDRYGYVAYESSIPQQTFGTNPKDNIDRVEVMFGFSDLSFEDQTAAWTSIGSTGTLRFGGGVGTGLGQMMGRGYGFEQALQQQTMGQNAIGGGPMGAMVSGQLNDQGANVQLGVGRMSPFSGGRRGRFSQVTDQTSGQGALLQFSAQDDSGNGATGSTDIAGTTALLGMSSSTDSSSSSLDPADNAMLSSANSAYTMSPMGLPSQFMIGSSLDGLYFHPHGLSDSITKPAPAAGAGHGGTPGAGGTGAGHNPNFGHYRGRYGTGVPAFTGGVRVNLGDLGSPAVLDNPVITAMAVDPETQDIWAGIGDTLVHFNRDGNPVGIYYLTLAGGASLKPTALLVEPDRLLIASDPWGIYEFARPDKLAPQPNKSTIAPQVVPQP
jgi:hypothetical protein